MVTVGQPRYGAKQHFLRPGTTTTGDLIEYVASGRTICNRDARGWFVHEEDPTQAVCRLCQEKADQGELVMP